jgi:hypothetical protein
VCGCLRAWLAGLQALAELFSDVGPVKRAFIIRGKDGQSKGFGFVQLYVIAGVSWTSVVGVDGRHSAGAAVGGSGVVPMRFPSTCSVLTRPVTLPTPPHPTPPHA